MTGTRILRKTQLRWLLMLASALAAGCATPERPQRATLYDFGPGAATVAAAPTLTQAPIVLAELESAGGLDSTALLYRLGYADAQQLHPYAQSRWSSSPLNLIRQRLREQLGRDRAVLDPAEAAAMARFGGAMPRVLRIDVEEFSHLFDSPSQSWGVLRLRASLFESTPAGERLLGQRSFGARQPASTSNASGGVRALAAAVDATAEDLRQWLAATR